MCTITEQSFSLQLKVFHALGLYPSKTQPKLQKVKGYTLYFCLLVVVTISMLINIIHKEHSDYLEMNLTLATFVSTAVSCFKLLPFIKDSDRIEKCINYFGDSWFVPKDENERRILEECVYVCRRNSWIYFVFLVCTAVAWVLPFVIAQNYVLPMDVWLHYNVKGRPMAYYTTLFFLTAAFAYLSFSATMLDPLLGGLAYHAKSQLKILLYNLHHLKRDQNDRTVTIEKVFDYLQRCVDLHNHILHYVAELEDCFSLSIFSQFVIGIFGISFMCIAFMFASIWSFNGFKCVMGFCILIIQLFFYCYSGTLLFEENERFVEAVCMGPWYDYDVKIRKILIIMMERSKRPMIIIAGKLFGLTLATFTSLVKTSYSLLAVMKKFQ